MDKFTFLELLFSGLNFLENFAKKIISFFTTIKKRTRGLKVSDTFGWSNSLQLKKGTYQLVFCLALFSMQMVGQNYVPFTPRFDQDLKGDILLIGNNILGPNNNAYNDDWVYNHKVDMKYIDIDGDPSTFSSSSADLVIPNPLCYEIVYAGLYWGAVTSGTEPITNIKFKGPSGGYNDIVGSVIYDAGSTPTGNSFPYSCYADVTSIVTGLATKTGTYTVANVSSAQGETGSFDPYNGTGYSAGWSLFIVYEDPTLPSKSITSFDGFSAISSSVNLDVPISGFRTVPAPVPVRASFAFAALEGDKPIKNDRLRINGVSLSSTDRPADNFFNSSVTQLSGLPVNNRNPNSTNTLGFDTGILNVPNPGYNVIPNDATSATVRLESSQDAYFEYFFALAVEIIEPKIVLTKIVEDVLGNDIGGSNVTLGDELNYVIGFQNTGNDFATNVTIRDVLPINTIFNYPADLDILPTGVSVQSYDPVTREIVFKIDDSVVEIDDPVLEIRFKVQVVPSCNMLSDACSNSIDNQAYVTYAGVENPAFYISDDPSLNTNTGCLLVPKATNFLVGVDDCLFTQTETLCGDSVVLTAANGYSSYSWSTDPSGSPVIGTTQSITVNSTGTYYVHDTAVAPCLSIDQEITVIPFGNTVSNPVVPFADEVVTCPNDGKLLPNIFLCGANAERVIQTGISDTSSIIWEKLDEGSCTAVVNSDCANESSTCTWTQVGTGPDFTANASGQYRVTLNYTGGCYNRYYFNVYQNLLNPTVTTKDIICNTPGEITVGGVPGGYEYSLDNITYQASNVFSITSQNTYTVYIRQTGITSNPCIFTVPGIQIRERNFTVSTVITSPLCNGDKGSVKIAANDVRPQYSYAIYSGGTLVNSAGPITQSDYTFSNLNAGTYTIEVTTEDGCSYTGSIEIIDPPLLTATAAITKPLTCTDGEITVYPVGGTAPYFYFVNSTTDFQTVPEIVVTASGVYDITVVDFNNCSTTTSITINDNPAPVYTISKTDILCYNDNSGDIQFNVTNANGYTLEYSIDNGVTYVSNPVFSNLSSGNYQVIIKYTLGASECFTIPETITINQPDEALTASSGVSELAGCGPSGEGKVRITNPQGGTPPYEYSFDNQATWVTTNESYVSPGTYTLYIKDANGCVYAMPSITLDPVPVAPTINVSDPDFNCDGTAGATVTVTNPGSSSFNYDYLLDGVPNTNTADPKTFLDVPSGSHTITVEYVLASVPTYSNLLYETFGYGEDTSSPGINPTYYCFERQVVATQCKGNPAIDDGDYSVTAHIVHPFGAWVQPVDHTPATVPATPKGRFLVVNIGATIPKTEILYEKQINDIIPNQPINVEFFAMNLLKSGNTQYDPDLVVALVDGSGVEISSFSTGNIPKTETWENYPKTPMTLDPGSNTSLKFIVRSNVQQTSGNDVAIDDISVYQLPKSCVTKVDFPFIVDSGKAFSSSTTGFTNVTCNGSADGTITIAAQNFDPVSGFEYSIDNGITWTTQMTSPYTITGLAAGNYDVVVRYETCSFSFSQTITQPAPLGVSVSGTPITCLAGSTVTATATGGTAAYSYQLLDTATLALVSNFPSNGILTNVAAGDYTVRVTDANGCTATDTINLVDSVPPTASIAMTSDYCYDPVNGATLEVTASGGVTPYEYSINGGSFGSSNVFANLTPGTYDITVRDAYGCTVTLPTETIEPQVTVNTTLTKELDCSATPDATITGTITGGYAPFSYEVSIDGAPYSALGGTGSPFVYTAATDGTYQFRVTDANGCQSVSNVITVASITNPVVTANKIDVSCNGSSDGSVQLVGSGGSGGYTYSDDNVTFTGTSLFTGLPAGSYTFYIKDSKSCTSSVPVTITEPTVLVASATATAFSCSATNTKQSAVITIAVPTTGTPPYQYSFNGGTTFSASNTLTVNDTGSDQTFSYVVKDANGCSTAAQNITITALDPPTDLVFSSTAVTCLTTTSTVTLTATNGVGSLEYETIAPSPTIVAKQASNVFTGLVPGTYVFRVTDANGCYYTESYTIDQVTNITVSGALINDVSCNSGSNGAVDFTVSNFTGTYGYTINGAPAVTGQSAATINLTALSAGDQIIVVTDETTGCTDTVTVTVSEPAALTLVETTNINANCNVPAQVNVTAGGGTPGYTYAFVQDGVSPVASDYTSSTSAVLNPTINTDWDVWVMDANGCTTKLDVVVDSDPVPTINPVPLQCFTGTPISITITGSVLGTPTYSIGGAYQSSPTFTINSAGTYNVSIKDSNGCIASTTYVVEPELLLDANMTQDLTCAVDASITLTPSGGTGTYTKYEVSIDGGATYVGISSIYTTNTAGTYQFRVTDSQGCEAESTSIIVNPTVAVTASFTSVNPTCNGYNDGSITLTALTGEAPFTYSIDNGVTFVSSNVFGGLVAGTYDYIVKDSKDCETTPVTITLNDPAPIVPTIGVNGIVCGTPNTLGSFDIDIASGGTAPYTYKLYDNSFTEIDTYTTTLLPASFAHSFTGHDFGDYYITIVDAIGCEYKSGKFRIEPTPYMGLTSNLGTASCATGVTVILNVTGGTDPYTYSIYGDPTSDFGPTSSTTHTFTGLDQGTTYQFKVVDANGCPSYLEITTDIISPIIINPLVATNVTCNGAANGEISFTVDQYDSTTADLYYEVRDNLTNTAIVPAKNGYITGLTGAPANGTITGLPAGNYTLYVKEFTGTTLCSTTKEFQITEPLQPLASAITAEVNANCNSGAQLTLTTTGGTGPYQYAAVRAGDPVPGSGDYGTSNVIIVDTNSGADLDWVIYVKDANDCETTINKSVIQDPSPTVTTQAVASNQCTVSSGFTFTATGSSGVPPYQYSINGGASYQSSDTFTVNTPGSYTVTIKDANGCTADSPTPTEVYAPLTSVANVTKELDCTGTPNAEITVTISGGNGPFTYTVQKGAGASSAPSTPIAGPTFTYSVAPGDEDTYTFVITDANGCTSTTSTTVGPISNPTASTNTVDPSCQGDTNGTVQIIATGGVGPYTYSFDGSVFTTTSSYTGLGDGTYAYEVRDSKSCSYTGTVTLTEPTALTTTATVTPFSCSTTNTKQSAEIVIDVPTTGTAPYQYSFNGSGYSSITRTLTINDNGTDQVINYTVKDANDCTFSDSVTITALDPPTDLTFTSTAVTCSATTSTVTLTAPTGVAPLTYAIVSPASATGNTTGLNSGIFTGLAPDTYMFEVTDANGCYYQESYTVESVTNITVSETLVNDVSCNIGANGAVDFTVSNFAGTYSYSINGNPAVTGQSSPTINLTGLSVGNQTIVVTDDITGCTDTATIFVREPTPLTLVEATNINANCNFGAQVSVTAGGGTPNYTYAFVENGVAPIATDYTSSSSAVLDPAVNTDWDVWVMDANGCTISVPLDIVIATDPLPSVTVPTGASNQCNLTGDPYTFTVTSPTGIGPFTYSIETGFQSNPTFTGLAPGTYHVTIKDANGCTALMPTDVIIYPLLDVTPTITTLPSCAEGDGVITVTGSGGSGNYAFSIAPSTSITQTGNVFSGLSSATNYTVTIEDTTTLCTRDVSVTLPTATPVTFTAIPFDVSCHGGSDGSITVNLPVSNDNPIYTYEITAGPTTVAAQTSNSFSGLAAGTYTVLVTSGRGCTLSQNVTVNEPNPIVVSAPIVVDYTCSTGTNTTNFATITVNTVTGGSGIYTNYEFIKNGTVVQFSNNNVYTESDLSGGTYTINVYDDKGCSGTTTASIVPYIELDTINVSIDNAITCINDEDITVSVSSIGGTPTNLEYTVEDIVGAVTGGVYSQTNTTGIFTGLTIGNYVITVTNLDTGCSLQKAHYVSDPNTFDLTIDSVVDVTCFNDSDGSVNVTFIDRVPTPTDDAGPFSYTVIDALSNSVASGTTTNAGPLSIPNLAAGTYTITALLTNAPYCSVSKSFTITAPTAALAISETHTEITCVSGNNDGSISATATGGWPGGYEFELSGTTITTIPFSSNGIFTNLSAGTYTVSVRDSRGCIASTNVVLANPIPIAVTASSDISLLSCFGDRNATITVDLPTGGQGSNYSYTLNTISPNPSTSGPQLSPVFTGLGAGTYTISVTDGYNCSATSAAIVIAEPTQIQSLLVKSTSQTCLTGTTLTLSATGGTGTYEYSDTAAFTTVLGSFTSSTTIILPQGTTGTFEYYVRDTNGCYADVSNQIKIDPLPSLVVSVDATNAFINCAGDNTGVIVATVQGGLGNYVYTLQDNLGNPIPGAVQNTPGVFTNLFAGNYKVQVDSGDCNTVSTVIAITEPTSPLTESHTSFDVTCSGSDNGILEINASGGTGVIKYAISPQLNQFFDTPTFDNLAPGTYDVIVQDELGCYIVFNFTINEPNPLMVNIVPGSLIPEACTGDMSGEFSIDITGGTAPYSVALDDINAAYTTGGLTQTQFDFTGLEGGDHVVYVLDGQGCESEWNITFPESVIINPEAVVDYGCVNNMSSNTVTVSIDESITNPSDVDYSLDGGPFQASNIFIDVAPGPHVIDARHTNGCIKSTAQFVIDQIDPLAMTIDDSQINQIIVTATGGSGIYEYALNGESNGSSNTFVIYQSGDYTVSVADSDGCTTEITRYFEYIDVCIPNYFTPNGDGVTDDWAPGCTVTYKDLEYSIFDRYGRKIATYHLGQKWDGTYNGSPLPTGDYWYVIKLNDKNDDREFVGHFTLYR